MLSREPAGCELVLILVYLGTSRKDGRGGREEKEWEEERGAYRVEWDQSSSRSIFYMGDHLVQCSCVVSFSLVGSDCRAGWVGKRSPEHRGLVLEWIKNEDHIYGSAIDAKFLYQYGLKPKSLHKYIWDKPYHPKKRVLPWCQGWLGLVIGFFE